MSKIKTDTSLWLHNKLGNVNDLWSAGSICSQLNSDILKNIRDCFTELQALVKLKLLISFLHIPRRNVDEWKNELKEIIEVAIVDSDLWVSMVGELLKVYPQTGTINFEIEENAPIFNELINELKKLVKKNSDQGILPIECLYLNKSAFNSLIGTIPPVVKHFTLRKNPKSTTLKSELMQRSNDAAASIRKGTFNLPIRNRSGIKDLNDSTPLRGIPRSAHSLFKQPSLQNRLQIGAGRNPTRPSMPGVRRDGGIKLLDINEQPLGPDSRKKKKIHDQTDEKSNKTKENEKSNIVEQTVTPDYAAGLTSFVPSSPAASHTLSSTSSSNMNSSYNNVRETQEITSNELHEQTTSSLAQHNLTLTYGSQNLDTHLSEDTLQNSNVPVPTPIKKSVTTLTKEQTDELRQISKTYPVGKNELSLIINFMSGNRVNPIPGADDIIRVKLGEKKEIARQTDGSLVQIISDAFYQMNYKTGEGFQVNTNQRVNKNINIQQMSS